MDKHALKKKEQLGMNPSTAANALKKSLMFHLAVKSEMDICFQCKKQIESSKELSVEHMTPWLDSEDPVGLYFDIDNLAFSHLKCNVGASRGKTPQHGNTLYARGCKCSICTKANTVRRRRYRAKRKALTGTDR